MQYRSRQRLRCVFGGPLKVNLHAPLGRMDAFVKVGTCGTRVEGGYKHGERLLGK